MLKTDDMKEFHYKCSNSNCTATDIVRLFPHEQPPPVINCWKCHSGLNVVEVAEMVRQGVGMYRLQRRSA